MLIKFGGHALAMLAGTIQGYMAQAGQTVAQTTMDPRGSTAYAEAMRDTVASAAFLYKINPREHALSLYNQRHRSIASGLAGGPEDYFNWGARDAYRSMRATEVDYWYWRGANEIKLPHGIVTTTKDGTITYAKINSLDASALQRIGLTYASSTAVKTAVEVARKASTGENLIKNFENLISRGVITEVDAMIALSHMMKDAIVNKDQKAYENAREALKYFGGKFTSGVEITINGEKIVGKDLQELAQKIEEKAKKAIATGTLVMTINPIPHGKLAGAAITITGGAAWAFAKGLNKLGDLLSAVSAKGGLGVEGGAKGSIRDTLKDSDVMEKLKSAEEDFKEMQQWSYRNNAQRLLSNKDAWQYAIEFVKTYGDKEDVERLRQATEIMEKARDLRIDLAPKMLDILASEYKGLGRNAAIAAAMGVLNNLALGRGEQDREAIEREFQDLLVNLAKKGDLDPSKVGEISKIAKELAQDSTNSQKLFDVYEKAAESVGWLGKKVEEKQEALKQEALAKEKQIREEMNDLVKTLNQQAGPLIEQVRAGISEAQKMLSDAKREFKDPKEIMALLKQLEATKYAYDKFRQALEKQFNNFEKDHPVHSWFLKNIGIVDSIGNKLEGSIKALEDLYRTLEQKVKEGKEMVEKLENIASAPIDQAKETLREAESKLQEFWKTLQNLPHMIAHPGETSVNQLQDYLKK